MDHFEDQLRTALRREDPDDNFSKSVLARLAEERGRVPWWRLGLPQPRWAVALALLVALLGLGLYRYEQQRERAAGQAARQQVMVALRIAGAKIHLAQTKVQGIAQR
jgi:ABC-type amino acid transport system permease subunit